MFTAALVTVTMLAVAFLVRQGVVSQFKAQYDAAVQATLQRMDHRLLETHTALHEQLARLATTVRNDAEFRFQVVMKKNLIQPFVIDYAKQPLATLDMQVLEIATADGVVISSGHDRNAFGKRIGGLIEALENAPGQPTVALFETTAETLPCLAAVEAFTIGTAKFYLVAGKRLDSKLLQSMVKDNRQIVLLKLPRSVIASQPVEDAALLRAAGNSDDVIAWKKTVVDDYSLGQRLLPVAAAENTTSAALLLLQPKRELRVLLAALNQRMIWVTALGILLALLLSFILGRSITRPLQRLASAAGTLSLERLDTIFDVSSKDEVGVLNDALSAMMQRLKLGRLQLASAEKKAAFAEIARQVNHDIKNGFIPIRNVMRHWQEAAEDESDTLRRVFNERKSTIVDSLNYLENLARKYSRLRPLNQPERLDLNQFLRSLLKQYEALPGRTTEIQYHSHQQGCWVYADAVQLRRAFENVIQNAMEAMQGRGTLTVSVEQSDGEVHVLFEDNGCGMAGDVQDRLFQPHVTTKETGTGLGLVSVKRIMEEAGGRVSIKSEVGVGTTVHITLPKAEGAPVATETTLE